MTKRLYKSKDNKILAGVLGGIGDYFDIDPTLLRLGYLLLAVLTAVFPAIIAYLVAAIIVPNPPRATHHKEA